MNYSLNGDLVVPPEAFLEGFDLSYSLNGNEKEFVLDYFEVNGKNCEGNINLVCNIPKLQLSGGIYIPFQMELKFLQKYFLTLLMKVL